MLKVTLPSSDILEFDKSVITGLEIAERISKSLAKSAIAIEIDGVIKDLSIEISSDCKINILDKKSPEGLEVIRHSTAHLLAQAVQRLYKNIQVTIGPIIADGFYYDFAKEDPFTPEDLVKIEKEMARISQEKLPVSRAVMDRDDAIKFFESQGEKYKSEIISDLPENEILSLYSQGEFTDLCRGPHVPHTGHLKVFKLTKIAGAYWRGDSNNEMLQRVYGTAWSSKEDLDDYLHRIEEAKKRDHRIIAKAMDLFHMQEEAPGMVFWHDAGWSLWQVIEQYIRNKLKNSGYQEIKTPQVVDFSLWEKSGHSAKYSEAMFVTESEKRKYALKPMSCPCHVQVFNQGLKSYRDLPIRLAEFGACHRNEPSGALHGLMRVRGFVQDDGHIFCSDKQLKAEVKAFIAQALDVYKDFGFNLEENIEIKLATRPENRIGDDALWDQAESDLMQSLEEMNIKFDLLPGEGAFYGPKIELHLSDCLKRTWQCGTIQLDFFMPQRLDASYIDENSSKKTPIMLHRAILGSFERFIGMLLEHYAGKLPVWLAPVQVAVLPISEKFAEYSKKILLELKKIGFRAVNDLRNEKIGFKIREHTLRKVPYQVIIGEKEQQAGNVSVRALGKGDLGAMSLDNFINNVLKKQEKTN